MLALTPTPEESWPPHPTSVPRTQFNGVFSMVRGKLKPPASRSLQRLQTLCVAKLSNSLLVTAAVQLAKPVQKPVPARAVSKNGCGVTAATGVKRFAGTCRDVVYAWKGGLRKRWGSGRNWRTVTIDADAERISNGGIGWTASTGHKGLATLDGLDQSGTQQRYEDQIDAVQTTINAAVPATHDSLVPAEHLTDEAVVVVRVPSGGDARAE